MKFQTTTDIWFALLTLAAAAICAWCVVALNT